MIDFFLATCIVAAYAILFTVVGRTFFHSKSSTFLARFDNLWFSVGASFFIGILLFLAFWTTASKLVSSATWGLSITTVTLFFVVVFRRDRISFQYFTWKRVLCICALIIAVTSVSVVHALVPMPMYFETHPSIVDPLAGFGGVVHSFRAGNLADHMVASDSFPSISQNSGQSILASLPSFLGIESPQVTLILWLALSISALMLMTYGFSLAIFGSPLLSLIPVAATFFGNTVLSPIYSSITDTESALFLARNIDSLLGIASFFILILVLSDRINGGNKIPDPLLFLIPFAWSITSGQMIPLFACAFFVLILFTRRSDGRWPRIGDGIFLFLSGSITGVIILGGMLHPTDRAENPPVPGLMRFQREEYIPLELRFPRTVENGSETVEKLRMIFLDKPNFTAGAEPIDSASGNEGILAKVKGNPSLFGLAKIVRSLQLVFFPIVGIVLLIFIVRRMARLRSDRALRVLAVTACVTFFIGFVASTFFRTYGYEKELSKFLYVGSYLGMLSLGISLGFFLWQSQSRLGKVAVTFVIAFIMIGPIVDYFLVGLIGNFRLEPHIPSNATNLDTSSLEPLAMTERMRLLIYSNGTYGSLIQY